MSKFIVLLKAYSDLYIKMYTLSKKTKDNPAMKDCLDQLDYLNDMAESELSSRDWQTFEEYKGHVRNRLREKLDKEMY